jgi:hypothetical protein
MRAAARIRHLAQYILGMYYRRVTAIRLLISFLAGLAIGGLTLVLQGTLPGAWNQLANSGAVWCVGGFAAGALAVAARRAAPWAGLAVLFGEVIGYYSSTTIFHHDDVNSGTLRGPLLWLLVACVAGPVFGLAGWAYRRAGGRGALIGMGALGAIFLAEALYLGVALGYWTDTAILAGIGILVPVVLGRSGRERLGGLGALAPLTLIGCAVEGGVYLIAQAVL